MTANGTLRFRQTQRHYCHRNVIGGIPSQLVEVFRRLRATNLRLNRKQYQFFQCKLVYLGHVASMNTLRQVKEESPSCSWIHRRRQQVREEPEKYADYILQNRELYRHVGLKPDEGEYILWKLAWAKTRDGEEWYDVSTLRTLGNPKNHVKGFPKVLLTKAVLRCRTVRE